MTGDRRLHEKLLQIFAEDLDRSVLCFFCQPVSHLTFDRRCDQTFIAVGDHVLKDRCCDRVVSDDHLLFQIHKDLIFRSCDLNGQELFFFSSV